MHYIPLIRTLRKANGLTQQQVAEYLHLDRSTYAYYESGRTKINIDILMRLARFFQVNLGQLVGEESTVTESAVLHDSTQNAETALINESVVRFQQLSREEQYLVLMYRSGNTAQRNALMIQANDLIQPEK